jgi:hypothetical protein
MEVTKSRGLTARSMNPTYGSEVAERAVRAVKGASSDVSVCRPVKPVGEPDAVNPRVRFDERGVETEQGKDHEAPATERAGTR